MSRSVTFRQSDLERALRAAKAVGYDHPTVDILPDGRLRVLTAPMVTPTPVDEFEAWERSLDGERAA